MIEKGWNGIRIKTREIIKVCQICKKRARRIDSRKSPKRIVSSKEKNRIKRVDKRKQRVRDVFRKGDIEMTRYSYDCERRILKEDLNN